MVKWTKWSLCEKLFVMQWLVDSVDTESKDVETDNSNS